MRCRRKAAKVIPDGVYEFAGIDPETGEEYCLQPVEMDIIFLVTMQALEGDTGITYTDASAFDKLLNNQQSDNVPITNRNKTSSMD